MQGYDDMDNDMDNDDDYGHNVDFVGAARECALQ